MKYQIDVRKLTIDDTSRDCPFPATDTDVYHRKLDQFINDLATLPAIDLAHKQNNSVIVETPLPKHELEHELQMIIKVYWCDVRFVDLEQIA